MNAATVARQGARGTRLLAVNEFGLVSHHAAGDLPALLRRGDLVVANECLQALRQDLEPKSASSRAPFTDLQQDNPTGKPRFVARIERQSHPRYFEPDRPRTLLSELADPVYHPHVVAAAREIASWRVYYVEPTRMRAEVGVQAADDPGRSGEFLAAFYYSL